MPLVFTFAWLDALAAAAIAVIAVTAALATPPADTVRPSPSEPSVP